ncbi:uncharacterized protein LOC126367627 [Pectinophora gossypiella]|uniref:uncharacterized protein LOC126367627 n=1 Tax=Pectinophora gossypiella TaxID=13191 RepID=UPI00214E50B5|nr:uncharacterized protein LOC126367627 [Pectinophora gossypiella]
MGPKRPSKDIQVEMESTAVEGEELGDLPYRSIGMYMQLLGETPPPTEWNLFILFDGHVVFETKWHHEEELEIDSLPLIDLLDPAYQSLVLDRPLIFLLRSHGGKSSKDPDPLTHVDNRAGAALDLLPLLIGTDEVVCKLRLLAPTGEETGHKIKVRVTATGPRPDTGLMPLVITMISAHCLPVTKDGTVYIAALGLDGLLEHVSLQFNMSLSTVTAKKALWAAASTAPLMIRTGYPAMRLDRYIPPDLEPQDTNLCNSVYWHAVRRIFVDPDVLRQRLASPFLIEIAGVPRFGKVDVRGRYMGHIDAGALLEPLQFSLTTCGKLTFFAETEYPEHMGPLLELPPASAKSSARQPLVLTDIHGHYPYIVVKFDIPEILSEKRKLGTLFDVMGFPEPDVRMPLEELYIEPPPEDPSVDVRKIRVEEGALAVHKELSTLACRGAVSMNQGIKRTAANKLLTRVRTMLKQFPPGECSYLEWQDTVTAQHAACRRAVTASFRPQPPPEKPTNPYAAPRAEAAGDTRVATRHIEHNLRVAEKHPRMLLAKILKCLEARNDGEAKTYLLRALKSQCLNKYLLWMYGALEFDKGEEACDAAKAAFRIAVKGVYSNGTAGAIGWGAVHTVCHIDEDYYRAFIAMRRVRKSHELKKEWKLYYQRWVETSGQEEIYWRPKVINQQNPLIVVAAFFLCLRCYKFSEKILQCLERGCATRGSRFDVKTILTEDIYYLRAASLLLRRQTLEALEMTEQGIRRFGPSPMMSQMRTTCLMAVRGWDEDCAVALSESESAGSKLCPRILMEAAIRGMKVDPEEALQRAARAHKIAPSGYTALVIARIYARKGEFSLAERWAAGAVKMEPLLADGWAVLALLAMGDRNVDKARTMLRTAHQAGPISEVIEKQLKRIKKIVKVDSLADSMLKNLCFCEYLSGDDSK